MAIESASMVLRNLQRADDLVRSFKQVAVDQSSNQKREINLKEYIEEVMQSLRPKFRAGGHTFKIDCPDDIKLETYPTAIYQTLVNLVMNSLVHGFEQKTEGEIRIVVSVEDELVIISYSDNGCGMSEDVQAKIFEPFFTTRRGRGGTGLGMHIVFNLVTQALKGRIEVASIEGEGTQTTIWLPYKLEG